MCNQSEICRDTPVQARWDCAAQVVSAFKTYKVGMLVDGLDTRDPVKDNVTIAVLSAIGELLYVPASFMTLVSSSLIQEGSTHGLSLTVQVNASTSFADPRHVANDLGKFTCTYLAHTFTKRIIASNCRESSDYCLRLNQFAVRGVTGGMSFEYKMADKAVKAVLYSACPGARASVYLMAALSMLLLWTYFL
eukprot:TRINITY_DN114359_c0_g1_i1.p1 TRINITY_DN114359_c0_g1~~TRINITY_DN114359_c0_g1_i1.p1  ORF type:complete len:192 (+),score=12.58 TRINITY_DN114359_c0_g1_i1:121-696(+)